MTDENLILFPMHLPLAFPTSERKAVQEARFLLPGRRNHRKNIPIKDRDAYYLLHHFQGKGVFRV